MQYEDNRRKAWEEFKTLCNEIPIPCDIDDKAELATYRDEKYGDENC